jgi:hypothetical protein
LGDFFTNSSGHRGSGAAVLQEVDGGISNKDSSAQELLLLQLALFVVVALLLPSMPWKS